MAEVADSAVADGDVADGDLIAQLRAKLAAVSARKTELVVPQKHNAVTHAVSTEPDVQPLCIGESLSALLRRAGARHGGLARGSVMAVSGARSVLVAMIAEVSAAGGCVAVVGLPTLSLHAATEMGADLSHIAVIPMVNDPVEIAAILLDGIDLVVVGLGGASVPPSRSRAVVARARAKDASLIVTDGYFSGVSTTVQARVAGYQHVPFFVTGHGRIGGVSLEVSAQRRGMPVVCDHITVRRDVDGVRLVRTGNADVRSMPVAAVVS